MTANELLTKDDLIQFKTELFNELKKIGFGALSKKKMEDKEWLKSYEVRKILGISPGTLQNMRINGTLAFTRIGGLLWYRAEDITKLLERNYHAHEINK